MASNEQKAVRDAIVNGITTMGTLVQTIRTAIPAAGPAGNFIAPSLGVLGGKLTAIAGDLATAPAATMAGDADAAAMTGGARRRSMHKKLKKGRKSRKNKSM